jgi:hypothetical protein
MTTKTNTNRFSKPFDKYCCDGDTIELNQGSLRIVARIEHDDTHGIDDDDCHNPDQSVTGCDDEQQQKLLAARKAWEDNEWFYCGIVLSVWAGDVCVQKHAASLWCIECNYPDSDNGYLTDVANELLPEALEGAGKYLGQLQESAERARRDLKRLKSLIAE